MTERIKLGIVGCGRFVQNFIPLFKAHPYVESVALCDLIRERAETSAAKHGVTKVFDSFEDMLKSRDINAVAIFVQRHLHGPLVIAALKAGKHVYSAVPVASSIEEIMEIEQLVRETRLTYSMGETGAYRACTVFCRKKFASGEMGDFVHGEAQYNHDQRHFDFKYSGGENWRQVAGIPPMLYPTHSTAMILAAMPGVYVKKLAAFGYVEKQDTDIFGTNNVNLWNNPFSCTAALMQLSNGGTARISENRRIAWAGVNSYITNFHGESGSYEFSVMHHYYTHWDPENPNKLLMEEVSDQLNPAEVTEHINDPDMPQRICNGLGFSLTSPIQPLDRLPAEFKGLNNCHNGTHQNMADDFCKAVVSGKLSPTNIWQAARFNIPGLIANQSALRDGETMDVPDLGNPPADWEVMAF